MKINTSMQDDKFSVEESTALLHAIFQNYPDIIGITAVRINFCSERASPVDPV